MPNKIWSLMVFIHFSSLTATENPESWNDFWLKIIKWFLILAASDVAVGLPNFKITFDMSNVNFD